MRLVEDKERILKLAEEFAKQELEFDPSGHDWWHAHRVRQLALELARREGANIFICELAALLHDVADEKLNTSQEAGLLKVRNWLESNLVEERIIKQIISILSIMSYNGGNNPPMETIEGKVVQDADRLDALGAMGIARTFLYSGLKGQLLHDPKRDFAGVDYRSNNKTAIYHFYEKLLRIKDLLNTESAREIATSRHQFLETFLEQFYREWDFTDNKSLDEI